MSVATAPSALAAAAGTPLRPSTTLWRDAARRFARNKLAVAALAVMAMLILLAIFADVLAPAPDRKSTRLNSSH